MSAAEIDLYGRRDKHRNVSLLDGNRLTDLTRGSTNLQRRQQGRDQKGISQGEHGHSCLGKLLRS